MELFKYIYYRVLVFYQANGDSTPRFMANMVICLILFVLILDLFFLFEVLSGIKPVFLQYLINKPAVLSIGILLHWPVSKYSKTINVKEMHERYKNERHRLLKGCLIGAYILLGILVPGILRHYM